MIRPVMHLFGHKANTIGHFLQSLCTTRRNLTRENDNKIKKNTKDTEIKVSWHKKKTVH